MCLGIVRSQLDHLRSRGKATLVVVVLKWELGHCGGDEKMRGREVRVRLERAIEISEHGLDRSAGAKTRDRVVVVCKKARRIELGGTRECVEGLLGATVSEQEKTETFVGHRELRVERERSFEDGTRSLGCFAVNEELASNRQCLGFTQQSRSKLVLGDGVGRGTLDAGEPAPARVSVHPLGQSFEIAERMF